MKADSPVLLSVYGLQWRDPGGLLPEKLGGGVRPTSQNPYPIYDQNLRHNKFPNSDQC